MLHLVSIPVSYETASSLSFPLPSGSDESTRPVSYIVLPPLHPVPSSDNSFLLIHNGGREDAPELLAATAASEPAKQTLSTEVEDNTRRMEQFQHMMAQIVKGAIAENNHALGKEVSELVRDYF